MSELERYKREVLDLLTQHRADHPQGFTEIEIQQRCPDLTLRGLKQAVEALEAEGKVHRALTDVGSYRIALAGTPLESIPLGAHDSPDEGVRPPSS
jgi:hypothetical protein